MVLLVHQQPVFPRRSPLVQPVGAARGVEPPIVERAPRRAASDLALSEQGIAPRDLRIHFEDPIDKFRALLGDLGHEKRVQLAAGWIHRVSE